ncbi:MAG: UV DNA damage repair endonuclease UvsE [Mycoplasmatota bacterium]
MKINLGYACVSKTLNVTSSTPFTYTEFLKTNDFNKLDRIINSNLEDLEKILYYNIKNNITFFRLTSKLIPLATKKDVVFDYVNNYKEEFNKLKPLIKQLRVDVHPDQFTVLNSVSSEVVKNSIDNLEYHYNILNLLGIENKIIILHVGSSTFGKKNSITRFINNFNLLPDHLKKSIAIENDDKVFNIKDCLYIANTLNIPFVLDYHHYICNNDKENLYEYMEKIFNTWKIKPKIHFSSPKSKLKKEFRSHHDYIDVNSFINFLENIKFLNKDFDIMLEVKAKDEALFKLIRQLKYNNYTIKGTTIYL